MTPPSFFGLDLGVKNGAVARLTLLSSTEAPAVSFLPWPSALLQSIPLGDHEKLIRTHGRLIDSWLTKTPVDASYRGFGDWSVQEVNWGRTLRVPASLKSFLAGLYTGALSPQVLLTWVAPRLVRRSLWLLPNASKADVWKAAITCCGDWGQLLMEETSDEDERDALTLAILAAITTGPRDLLPPLVKELRPGVLEDLIS